ncbi:MAG TPA: MauE/DoxX family redox-associated membrane protein, partial [Arenibacter sp.]|nr:MauE/DoxX family redox-associated membrane protein [Arenibacter sp.]
MKWLEKHKRIVVEVICCLFILLFVYAAMSKLLDFENFRVQLGQSPLLTAFAGWVAWGVPVVEILVAGMLFYPRLRLWALYAAFSLMVMFTAYIVIILNFSDFIPCSCGGVLEKLGWTEHLIFNLVFVAMAGIGIWLLSGTASVGRRMPALLALSAVGGIVLVTGLFLLSEDIVHERNNFTRRYPQHPIKRVREIDLGFNSYYLAGAGDGKIYLGNTTAPLHLVAVDTTLKDTQHIRIKLDKKDLPFLAVKVQVRPPHFYVTDGTVPSIFQGSTTDWHATMVRDTLPYFSLVEPLGNKNFALRTRDHVLKENVLGRLILTDSVGFTIDPDLLVEQGEGVFSTDGQMVYNKHLKELIFIHYYRNEYIIMDSLLRLRRRSRTIDTISRAKIDVVHIASQNSNTLGAPPLLVNKMVATAGPYLLVNSSVMGKFESKVMWQEAAIVDVYNLEKDTYEFSFYLHHKKEHKPKQFLVYGKTLISLLD